MFLMKSESEKIKQKNHGSSKINNQQKLSVSRNVEELMNKYKIGFNNKNKKNVQKYLNLISLKDN